MLITFLVMLGLFLIVGISSVRKSTGKSQDYYVASRTVAPWLTGLSAMATNNSGYMFIGVIGFTYATGLAAIWLMVGWILGDFLASLFIHKKLRAVSGKINEVTFGGLLSRWQGTDFKIYRKVAALITILFLGAYAAAQLKAGGKALHVLFGWDLSTGAIIGAIVVAAYCLAGGIRASIWTDAAQSVVMVLSMLILLVTAVYGLGGWGATWQALGNIPGFLSAYPEGSLISPAWVGLPLFIIGWLFAGVSVIGQPHIMIRFMALENVNDLTRARVYYYGWFTTFYALATGVGLLSRLYLPGGEGFDAELALPMMALELLPPALVGVILAGIFAATMSTADSLVLSCSAALTHDLTPNKIENVLWIKFATFLVTALALAISLGDNQSVFRLVIMAWSVLASAFAPLLIIYASKRPVSELQALAMTTVGVAVNLIWIQAGYNAYIYEGMPGILAGLATWPVARKLLPAPTPA